LSFEIDTANAKRDFGDADQRYIVEADVTDASRRTISGEGEVLATRNQFHVHVETDRGYYETGSTIRMNANALLPTGAPIATQGEIRIAEVVFRGDNGDTIEEAPIEKKSASTDAEGRLTHTFDVQKSGQYRLSYVAKDAWGGEVVGTALVWVWGSDFDGRKFKFNHLEVITDKRTYEVGETAKLLISSDIADAHVLFSAKVDNGHLLAPEVLALNGKTRMITIPITAAHVPNFFVEATVIAGGKMSEEVRELYVPPPQAELRVNIVPKSGEFRAGKEGELEITTTDPAGKPVSANVAVSVFDKAVLYIQSELTPDVRKHFWGRTKSHQVQSQTNLRRRYDNWQYMSQPDQQAAYAFASAMNEWMHRDIDFTRGDVGFIEQNMLGAATVTGDSVGFGGLGLRGAGVGGGGEQDRESLAKDAREPPAAAKPQEIGEVRLDANGKKSIRLETLAIEGRMGADEDLAQNKADSPAGLVAPVVRKNFADTALWRVVQTDARGKATLTWKFPDNLTTWRTKAIALSDDTRVGEASASVITTKKLLLRLQAPRFFRERDRVMITANIHNRLAGDKKVKVELDVTDTLLKVEGDKTRQVTVPRDGEQRVDFWVTVHGEGEARVKLSALTDEESDAKELLFPVLVHGFMKTDSAVGSISVKSPDGAEKSITLKVPAERRLDQGELVVRWSPTLAGAMIDALPYLLDYPYGCTEQTMSRFVPAVLTRKTLQLAGGYSLEDLAKIRSSMNPQQIGGSGDQVYRKRIEREYRRFDRSPVYNTALMDEMIASGLGRISRMQRPDGGWGWWSDDRSSVDTTAYVLFGLFEARSADVGVPEALIQRGLSSMEANLPGHLQYYQEHEWVSDTDAFYAYVMSLYGRSNEELNKYLFDRRAKLSVYGKSLLALALWNLQKKDEARLVLRNAEQFLKEDPENETVWVDTRADNWWYWWNSEIESNAFFLRALVTIKPDDERGPRLVKWLLNHRKNGWYWNSTRDTALTISSFAHFMRATKEAQTDYDLEVMLDGKVLKKVHIDSKNLLTFDGELRIPTKELPSGEHKLSFRRRGKGAVYFNSYLSYFTLEEDAPASGLEIKVERKYFKLVREDRKHEVYGQRGQEVAMKEAAYRKVLLKSGEQVVSGDLILVELMLESKNDYSFLAFEDPKPAGAEPVALRSGETFGEAVANLELRDDRVVFFLRELNQGKLKLEYRLRAEIPGTFHAMPTRGFAMYAPELQATSEEMRVTVTEGPGD
jgi:alpha-2-macroglobulin